MSCLIIAQSAIFTIFVAAYLFYLAKRRQRPLLRGSLELPILTASPSLEQRDYHPRLRSLRK